MQASARIRHAIQKVQDLIYHVSLLDMSRRWGDVDGLPTLRQLGLNEALSKVDAYGLPFHSRCYRHAATNSGKVWHRGLILWWKREEMTLVPMGRSLRLTFFRQPRANRPVISLPCSSFQIGANRSLRIAAPLCFGSGSVRSIQDRSWSALLAASSHVSSCSSDLAIIANCICRCSSLNGFSLKSCCCVASSRACSSRSAVHTVSHNPRAS